MSNKSRYDKCIDCGMPCRRGNTRCHTCSNTHNYKRPKNTPKLINHACNDKPVLIAEGGVLVTLHIEPRCLTHPNRPASYVYKNIPGCEECEHKIYSEFIGTKE